MPTHGGSPASGSSLRDPILLNNPARHSSRRPPPTAPNEKRSPSCCVIALWLTLGLCALFLAVRPILRDTLDVSEDRRLLCNNTLDFGGLDSHGYHRSIPVGATCAQLIEQGKYSCAVDFCAPSDDLQTTCALGPTLDGRPGLCDEECANPPYCEDEMSPGLEVCLHRALGGVEAMVIILYVFAWVNLMFPTLLPLARCTTALASAAMIVATRKLGHDVPWPLFGDGQEVHGEAVGPSGRCYNTDRLFEQEMSKEDVLAACWDPKRDYPKCISEHDCTTPDDTCHPDTCIANENESENPGYVEMSSYGVIEMPVISLLAGLMILAGFMEELGAFDSIAHFIQRPGFCCLSSDTAGGVTLGVRCPDRTKVWKNGLVATVLAAMMALFLLGPTLGQLDVGGIAFSIGLTCLTGLGIWSARSAPKDEAAVTPTPSGQRPSEGQESQFDTIRRVTSRLQESFALSQNAPAKRASEIDDNEPSNPPPNRKATLLMVSLVSASLSAIIMNDTVCLVFAPMIVSKLHGVDDRFPYLLALATSANIGSALTNVGNPQNNLISTTSALGFGTFVKFMALPVGASMLINVVMLMYWPDHAEELRAQPDRESVHMAPDQPTPGPLDRLDRSRCASPALEPEPEPEQELVLEPALSTTVSRGAAGPRFSQSTTDASQRGADLPRPGLGAESSPLELQDNFTEKFLQEKIDVPLLLLFTGQFIMVQGLVDTGVPKCIWGSIEVFKDPLASDDPFGTIMFALAVVILSNLLSNVPLILMMRPMLSELARKDEHEAQAVWLMVAFLSTMAGNLVLIGSAANLIVASAAQDEEQKAAKEEGREERPVFASGRHAKFGIVLTMATCLVGGFILYVELKYKWFEL